VKTLAGMVMDIAEQSPRAPAQCNENSGLERHGLVVGCALLPKKVIFRLNGFVSCALLDPSLPHPPSE
jgi:hypothetical protein